jgi:hypothetical protein
MAEGGQPSALTYFTPIHLNGYPFSAKMGMSRCSFTSLGQAHKPNYLFDLRDPDG